MTINEYNSSEFLADYFSKGVYCFKANEAMKDIPIDNFKLGDGTYSDNCFHAEGYDNHETWQAALIEKLKIDISEYFFKEFAHKTAFDFMAFSVNDKVQNWHNDAQYTMPNQNASINCFFDDTSEALGGVFQAQPWCDNPTDNSELITSVYPKKNTIVVINQNRNFIHRAGANTKPRRMISFACTFTDINPILPNFSN